MALGVNDVYRELLIQMRKNQKGMYLSGSEYNRMAKRVQEDWFNDKYKEYESSSKNTDDMRVLKSKSQLSVTSGQCPLPTDYYHFDKLTYSYYTNFGTRQSRVIDNITSSEMDYGFFEPSLKYPKLRVAGGNMEILPTTISSVTLEYLRTPTAPIWGYTTSGTGRESYNSATSVDFEVPDYAFSDIVNRMFALVEISLSNGEMAAYGIANENKS